MSRRGFSLIEALFTALLVSMALGMVGLITHYFQRAMNRSSANDSGLQAMMELHQVASEVEQASSVSSPALTATSALLQFQRINPAYPNRLPATLLPEPSPLPAAWEPRDPAYLVLVSYTLQPSGQLLRRVDFSDGSFEQQICADSLANFQAQHASRGSLTLTATVLQAERRRTVSLLVNLPTATGEQLP
ncbi:MAG: hypothetical protein U0931_11855 [Vulcanimicrobiota bacterium]